MSKKYQTFSEFYPFYLSQHENSWCRGMHYLGSLLVVITFIAALITLDVKLIIALPLIGYGFAWLGHFVFEKNRPATFEYPLYSFLADWVMLLAFLRNVIKIKKT